MTETTATIPRTDLPALTGVRAVAALWVLGFHAQWTGFWEAFPAAPRIQPFFACGYLGVDLFFVLSGFILTHTYAEELSTLTRPGYVRYLVARFARIYPVHLFVMLAMAAWVVVVKLEWAGGPWHGHRFRAPAFFQHLALLQVYGLPPGRAWNVPTWSISAEWFAYLWFPFACAALLRVRSAAVGLLGALLALAAVIAAVPLLGFGDTFDTTATGGLVRIAGEFTAGALLCRAGTALRGRRVPWSAVSVVSTAAAFTLVAAGHGDPWCLFPFGALILSLAADEGPVARLLGTPVFVAGGKASYALYLVHVPMIGVIGWLCGRRADPAWSPFQAWTWAAALVLVPIAVAFAVWRFVEEPARRRIRAWATPRAETRPQVAAG